MARKWLLISILSCLFLSYSCTQLLQPNTPIPNESLRLFVTPLDPSIGIDGTPYDNPMEMIEAFARQTAVAQTETANPYHPSALDAAQTPSAFSEAQKMLYIVLPNGSRVAYSPLELETFPQVTVSVSGQDVKGVPLLTILERAGWDANNAVAISVNGIGSLAISKEKIGKDYVLIFTGSSLRFVSPSIPEDTWIEGVTIIEVY